MTTKLTLLFLLLFCTINAQAQYVNFKLQKNGSFLSEEGKTFVVVQHNGKPASELYSMVKSNVIELYNNP